MKKTVLTVLLCAVLVTAGQAFAAVHTTLLQPAPADLVSTMLVPASAAPQPVYNSNRDPVSFSWPLKADQKIDLGARPVTKLSREYWQRVSADQLAKGVAIHVVTPGAVIRINPMGHANAHIQKIDPSGLEIITSSRRHLTAEAATQAIAKEADLDQAGFQFPKGTIAFRLKADLGTGTFTIRDTALRAEAATPYLLSVVEPHSAAILAMTTKQQALLPGAAFIANVHLKDGNQRIAITRIDASVISPDGRITPAHIAQNGVGSATASFTPGRLDPRAAGMWEIKVSTTGNLNGQTVRRDIRAAFAYSLPTARLTNDVTIDEIPGGGIAAHLGIESSAGGRYEVRGILYGTNGSGNLAPMGIADTAAWLPDGVNTLTLTFGPRIVEGAGFHAPYEVRGLRLMDQSRMSILRQQARAFVIPRIDANRPSHSRPHVQ